PPVARSTSAMAAGARAGMRGGEAASTAAAADPADAAGAARRETIRRGWASAAAVCAPVTVAAEASSTGSSQPASNRARAMLGRNRRIRGSRRKERGKGRAPNGARSRAPVAPATLSQRDSLACFGVLEHRLVDPPLAERSRRIDMHGSFARGPFRTEGKPGLAIRPGNAEAAAGDARGDRL